MIRRRTHWVSTLLTVAFAAALLGCPTGGGPGPPTFTISGRVTDATTGAGIQGVTVTIGGRTAITDANGNYSLAGLQAGTYTVVPGLAGASFTPAQRSVTVGPDRSSVDFTGTSGGGGSGGAQIVYTTLDPVSGAGSFWRIAAASGAVPKDLTALDVADIGLGAGPLPPL